MDDMDDMDDMDRVRSMDRLDTRRGAGWFGKEPGFLRAGLRGVLGCLLVLAWFVMANRCPLTLLAGRAFAAEVQRGCCGKSSSERARGERPSQPMPQSLPECCRGLLLVDSRPAPVLSIEAQRGEGNADAGECGAWMFLSPTKVAEAAWGIFARCMDAGPPGHLFDGWTGWSYAELVLQKVTPGHGPPSAVCLLSQTLLSQTLRS